MTLINNNNASDPQTRRTSPVKKYPANEWIRRVHMFSFSSLRCKSRPKPRHMYMTCKSAIQYHQRTPAANTAARCQRQPWKLRLLNTGLLHGLYCITLSCFYSVQSTLYCIEKTRPLFILDTRPGWDRPWDGWLPTWSTGPLSGRVWLGVQVRFQLFSPDSSSYFVRRMRSCIISPFFLIESWDSKLCNRGYHNTAIRHIKQTGKKKKKTRYMAS